jgi:hypothetical protein
MHPDEMNRVFWKRNEEKNWSSEHNSFFLSCSIFTEQVFLYITMLVSLSVKKKSKIITDLDR